MFDLKETFRLSDLRVRAPYILPDPATQTYYLCTSLGKRVGVYHSTDLENWSGPVTVFEAPADFWAQRGIWAPEMHRYRGRYYLFLTFNEWVQLGDGTIEAIRLSPDLSEPVGEPVILFSGSAAARGHRGHDRFVTDGLFIYRTRTGRLLILWSTFGWQGYMTLMAASESGSLQGPWTQLPRPLFSDDGGHAMVFRTFDERLMLILHHPYKSPEERALLFAPEDTGDTLAIVQLHPAGNPFEDLDLPIEARVDDILSRMTLDEKVACLGIIPNVPRLGIWGTGHVEGLHGLAMGGPGGWGGSDPVATTQFPQAIGLGETWDPDLIERAAAVEGYETRYMAQAKAYRRGGLVVRAPNADLGRDIRWGRNEECYGEDAFLNGTLVTAFVRGLQGNDPRYWQTASLLKHFLANSNEDEHVHSSSDFDERLLREYYSVPFRMGVVDGGARAYMAAYNAYNGIPCTVHPILKDITVDEWGQDGIIYTDAGALTMLVTEHHYYPDPEMAAAASIKAGISQFLDRYREGTLGALASGLLTEADIDASLRGVFRVMIRLGLLDQPEQVTSFAYDNLQLSADRLGPGEAMVVRVDVTNTGDRVGDEVVQLYGQHLHSATRSRS